MRPLPADTRGGVRLLLSLSLAYALLCGAVVVAGAVDPLAGAGLVVVAFVVVGRAG